MIPRFLLSFVFFLALAVPFGGVSGRPNSPVVCIYPGERISSHPSTALTTNPSNFRFTINGGAAVTAGSQVTIQLTGAAQFIGFLGYVTDANNQKAGTFNTATFTDQSLGLYECDPNAPGSTLGNSNKNRKGPTVSWGWRAPANAAGTMTVRALVMTAFSTYYSITQTFTVGAAAPATTLAPATTIPSGNGGATTTKAPTVGTTNPPIVTTAAQTSAPTNGPPAATTFLSPDLDFFVSWTNNGDGTMDFTMATNGNGYVSIGICTGPLMRDTCDYITGWIKQGKATLIDTYSVGRVIPRLDTSNGGTSDVTEVSSTALGTLGGTSITFRRKLVTSDANDVSIINAEQYIQWAYTSKLSGTETATNYPLHDADGYFQANLLAVDGGQPSATTSPAGGSNPVTTPSPAAANSYTSDDKKFYAKWKKNNDDTIDITMETSGKGWVSFGICDGPEMANKCDYITGWVNGNTPVLLDTYADVYNIPPVDADNGGTDDLQMISFNKVGSVLGGTSFTFRRKLDTGDTTGDLAITNSVQYFQYGYTNNAVPTTATKNNYPKHSDYGVFQTNLLAASAGVITTAQPAATTKQVDAGQVTDLSYTSKDGKFSFNWQIIGDKIRVTMSAATLGWISVGWCDGPKMPNNCDYVTGGIDGATGTPYLYDTYSDSYDTPPIDTDVGGKNDYTLVPGTAAEDAAAGTTTLTFERLLNTNDPKDYPITDAPIYCQWSYGPGDGDVTQKSYPQHARGAYGAVIINFYQGGATEASEFQARISNGAWLLFISLALFGTWVVMRYARKAKKAMHASTMKSMVQNVYKNNDVYDPNSHKLFKNISDRSVTTNQVAIDVAYDGRHIRNASQQPMSSADSALQRWRQQWIPIQTEDGYTYYYNSNLQETAWEIPEMPELFGRDTDSVSDYGTGAPRYSNNSSNNYNNYNNNNAKGSAPSALSAQLTLEAKKGGGCCTAFRVVCASRLPCTQLSTSDLLLFGGFLALNALCFFALDSSSSTPRKLGYLASANFVLVCIPATRNSPLIWLLGFPFDRVIVFHRWLAPWTFFVTTLHMIAYIQEWKGLGLNVNKMLFSDQENYYGFLSWLFTALVLITSWEFFRRRYFNFFYFAHFMFIAVFVLAYLHVPQAFLPYVFVIIVVYGLDRLVRFLWSIQCTSTVKLVPKDSDILLVRFKKNWLAKALNLYKIGQYVFVNFPGISPLAWHPFTLSSSPEEQTAEVHIRGLGDYTKKLIDQVKLNNGSPMMIRVDGPYGNHRFTYRRYPSLLLFGGGIGITPIVAMLRDIYRVGDFPAGTTRPPHVIQSIYVAWIVPNAEKYKWFQAELEQVWKTIAAEGDNPAVAGQPNGLPYLSIWVYASRDSQEKCNQWSSNNMGTTFVSGKPDFDSIFSTVKNNHSTQAVSVFACGPASLTSMVWDECSAMQSKGNRFDFHHETFDW